MLSGYRRVNVDGSRNVHCTLCHNFIGSVSHMTAIHSAICAVCQAEKEGIDLTPEQVESMRAVRVGGAIFSHAAAFPETAQDPMVPASTDEVELTTNRIGYFVKALVRNIREGIAATIEETMPASKTLAKLKKRKRIFEQPIDDE